MRPGTASTGDIDAGVERQQEKMAVDGIAEALAVTLPFLDWSHRPDWTRAAGARDRDVRIPPWGRP